MPRIGKFSLLTVLLALSLTSLTASVEKFNASWIFKKGPLGNAQSPELDTSDWREPPYSSMAPMRPSTGKWLKAKSVSVHLPADAASTVTTAVTITDPKI